MNLFYLSYTSLLFYESKTLTHEHVVIITQEGCIRFYIV